MIVIDAILILLAVGFGVLLGYLLREKREESDIPYSLKSSKVKGRKFRIGKGTATLIEPEVPAIEKSKQEREEEDRIHKDLGL